MRPTPLTDAAIARAPDPDGAREVCDLCEALERQLGEAREALALAAALPTHQDCPVGNHGVVVAAMEVIARIDALDPDNLEGPGRTEAEMVADARELDRIAPTPADKFALMFRGTPNPEYANALDERPGWCRPNPDWVDAPKKVLVATIDPATGEMSQTVVSYDEAGPGPAHRSYDDLNKLLGIDQTLADLAERHAEKREGMFRGVYHELADEADRVAKPLAPEAYERRVEAHFADLGKMARTLGGDIDDDLDEPLPPNQCGMDNPDCESCQ